MPEVTLDPGQEEVAEATEEVLITGEPGSGSAALGVEDEAAEEAVAEELITEELGDAQEVPQGSEPEAENITNNTQ